MSVLVAIHRTIQKLFSHQSPAAANSRASLHIKHTNILSDIELGIQHKRLQTTGSSAQGHQHYTSLPSMRQAVLDVLSFNLPERQMARLEDIAVSRMLHLKAETIASAWPVQPCIYRLSLELTSIWRLNRAWLSVLNVAL